MSFNDVFVLYIRRVRAFIYFYRKNIRGGLSLIVSLFIIFFFFAWNTPHGFPKGSILTIDSGTGLNQIATNLKNDHIIRSTFWFKVFAVLKGNNIVAGDYALDEYQTVFGIVGRLSDGKHGLTPTKVTIPEGMTNREISALLERRLRKFDTKKFLELTKDKEGYMFPDTYFFIPHQDPQTVIKTMTDTFDKRLASLSVEIQKFGKPLSDIINMASIIEEEGKDTRSRQVIAGILWKRMAKGMMLQVDAPFRYSIGKDSSTLTLEDLRTDNPYNTYTRKGLPPTPITNPGLDSIYATIRPISTPYFFFLSDEDGTMYYAATYEEHLVNKATYIR